MPTYLSADDVAAFHETGCLVAKGAVRADHLAAMNAALDDWIEESRAHTDPYGEMSDGRVRFDVQPGHCADRPALRRVQSPTELSDSYLLALTESPMIDMLSELIGPNLRFHHSKVNCKLPGAGTVVDWHQDFPFDPHSNDDMVTCLMFMGDVTDDNGPLLTVPGSHTGPIHSLWRDGQFAGAVRPDVADDCERRAVAHTGPAGSVCFMHTRVLHASRANLTDRPRNLFIANIAAADAVPLARNHVPSVHAGMLLRGTEPNRIRAIDFDLEPAALPETTFFQQQAEG